MLYTIRVQNQKITSTCNVSLSFIYHRKSIIVVDEKKTAYKEDELEACLLYNECIMQLDQDNQIVGVIEM